MRRTLGPYDADANALIASIMNIRNQFGIEVSPHVLNEISCHVGESVVSMGRVAAALDPLQLSGEQPLQEILPSGTAPGEGASLCELPRASSRALLFAALDRTGDPSVVLAASALDAGVFLGGDLARFVCLNEGRVEIVSQQLRSLIVETSTQVEQDEANLALARTASRGGYAAASALGLSRVESVMGRTDTANAVLREASHQLQFGFPRNAYNLARTVPTSNALLSARARQIMGHSAFWNGSFAAARNEFTSLPNVNSRHRRSGTFLSTMGWFERGPWPENVLMEAVHRLQAIVEVNRDRAVLADLLHAEELWDEGDEAGCDTICAQVALSLRHRSEQEPTGWEIGRVAMLSPVVRAILRAGEVGLRLQAGQWDQAAGALAAGIRTVPFDIVPAGLISSLVDRVARPGRAIGGGVASYYQTRSSSRSQFILGPKPGPGILAFFRSYPGGLNPQNGARNPVESTRLDTAAGEILTNRQEEVYALLLGGITNREIGLSLGISERTVEAHLAQIFRKRGVHTRGALIARGITQQENGMQTS